MESVDWNAEVYHRVSEPQFRWGQAVLAELELQGGEVVLDAGCGSGRLTALLCERVSRGRVIALDGSQAMLDQAKATLARFGDRVSLVQADLGALELSLGVDVVFSTATFHWIQDHDALFAGLARSTKPGGQLHAQCGGKGNLTGFHALAARVAQRAPFAEHLAGAFSPTYFAGVEETRERLANAGWEPTLVRLVDAPTPFPDAASFATFVAHVILRYHLAALPEPLRQPFLDGLLRETGGAYSLDYVRLDLRARRGA